MGNDAKPQQTEPSLDGQDQHQASHRRIDNALYKLALFVLSSAIGGLTMVVYRNHVGVSEHASQFTNVWTPDFRAQIAADLVYPGEHEAYRVLYVQQAERDRIALEAFKAKVNAFISAGNRFTPRDFEQGTRELRNSLAELRIRTRQSENNLAILSERIRICEDRPHTHEAKNNGQN